MRNMLLLCAALVLQACASNPPPPKPLPRPPMPAAVTVNLPASTEGSLTQSLQEFLNELRSDLQQSLDRARRSPPHSVPVRRGVEG